MHFTRLRLSGFKSFVDATELLIESGITGIVGPNGCGKSNLVEALRWVMGETSAKRMRGSEMDDVIFGGTTARPSRNLAEVVLHLDNRDRTAPATFNHLDEIEVSRRIERGGGSDYRVNGRLVRARDVQLLFQDNSSGANSPALVSQGRVSVLIHAKPAERRLLLEEAAGIIGLHSRRHEAELRLRAAEENLTRLEDVIRAMDGQLTSLKKQARQAARYRTLSEQIRRTEAVLLHLRWQAGQERLRAARTVFDANEKVVGERMLAVARATTERTDAAAALPPLRQAEAAAAAALQRLVLARDGLDAEAARVAGARQETERRLDQIAGDVARETALAADAGGALTRLAEERARLAAAQQDEGAIEAEMRDALAEAAAAVETLDGELTRLTEQAAAAEAQRQAQTRRLGELDNRLAGLAHREAETLRQQDALEAELADSPDLDLAAAEQDAAEETLDRARAEAEAAERARHDADAGQEAARAAVQAAEVALARLQAEADALKAVFAADRSDRFPPLLDAVTVHPGYETAVGAAFGDELAVPLDMAAPIHWRTLPPLADPPALPEAAEGLAARVRGPEALARRLAQIGVVADADAGHALAAQLAPGQQLVSREGGHWRWDGLTAAAGAPTAAAARFKQRNRLAELAGEIDAAQETVDTARHGFDAAREAGLAAQAAERAARQAVQTAFAAVNQARDRHAKLAQAEAARQSRLAALRETLDRLASDRAEVERERAAAQAALAGLPDTAAQRAAIAELRADLAERRSAQAERRNALDAVLREAEGRRKRLAAIAAEEQGWQSRAAGTRDRLAELERRAAETRAALDQLARRPDEIARQREALLDRIAEAEAARRRAADALAAGETRLAEADRALKAAEAVLAEARETRVRAEAEVSAAMTALTALEERIAERLQCRPDSVAALAALPEDEPPPDAAAVEARLDRILREREAMGPVNLRAEGEAAELEQQIAGMERERADLIAAIARLRQGIANLDREARERLLASFDQVDGHFQRLFTSLFGGGKAYLKLTEADDPLEAGLDIFASPPGKKLQNLTLLSGGEQALTAIALLFAVFLTNPAPICVLDEVDAPLDDANVDRFCSLLEELKAQSATRFLVITHHRMTMARADRLFGVTMPERGVSQLVSVDLQHAEALRKTA